MPKLERWLIAARKADIFNSEEIGELSALGANVGGGWDTVHQHVYVNAENKEDIEEYLRSRGFQVVESSDKTFFHPESHQTNHDQAIESIEACREFRREQWAVGRSFERMHSEAPVNLLAEDLVSVVAESADDIAALWLKDVRANPTTTSYSSVSDDEVLKTVSSTVTLFGRWLQDRSTEVEVRQWAHNVGLRRRELGVASHEVISALTLLRKHIWMYARSHGLWERMIELYRVLELDRLLVLFFDIAMYHTARAYSESTPELTAPPQEDAATSLHRN